MTIGERIKLKRKSLNLTLKDISQSTKISAGNLSGFENDRYAPSVASLVSLSKALNCSIDWIITGTDPQEEIQKIEKDITPNLAEIDEPVMHKISEKHSMLAEPNQIYESENKISNDSTFRTIGQRIKLKRKSLNLTLNDISQFTKLSTGNLSELENDKYAPSVASLVSLSKALNCSIEWLATGEVFSEKTNEKFESVGMRINKRMNLLGLKQIDIIKATGISKTAISNYVKENRLPDTMSIYKLSKILKVSIEWLLTGYNFQEKIQTIETNEDLESVSTRINERMNLLGLRQIDIIKATGISKNAISNYVNENRIPDTMSIYKLSKVLKISIEWLLTGSDPQEKIQKIEKDITPIDNIVTENGCDYVDLNSMYTIGDRIKVIRITKNINQKEFSDAIKIGQSRLSEFESNKTKPSFDTLYSIKKVFNISLDWLISGEGEPFINAASKPHPMLAEPNQSYESDYKVPNSSKISTIGQRIKGLRVNNGLSIQELADLIGKSKGNISGYENDKYEPSAQTIISIANYFKVSTDWLLNGIEFQNQNEACPSEEECISFSELETDIISMYRVLNVRDREEIFNCIYNKYKYEQNKFWEKGTSLYSTYFEESEETSTNNKQDKRKKGSGIA